MRTLAPAAPPTEAIAVVALAKARAVALRLPPDTRAVVLGADTEVVLDRRIYPCMSEVLPWAEIPRAHQMMWKNEHKPGNMAVLVNAPYGTSPVGRWATRRSPVETTAPPDKTYAELEKRARPRLPHLLDQRVRLRLGIAENV